MKFRFLDEILAKPDVYVVSVSQGLEWVKNPTNLTTIINDGFDAWEDKVQATQCPFPRNCEFTFQGSIRYMKTCTPCPTAYPWLGNPLGQ